MTQAELFRQVASAGLGGGFAYGKSLPEESGMPDGIMVINYEANQGSNISSLVKWLIEYFDEKPIRGLELRYRQLKRLLKEIYKKNQHVVIVIYNADILSKHNIKFLKGLHEICDGPYPGLVLLGDMVKLEKKINSLPEIKQRITCII
jgi:type II secretory pathway predicted ATPase ExeA